MKKRNPHAGWRGGRSGAAVGAAAGVLLLGLPNPAPAVAAGAGEEEDTGEVVVLITDHREAIDDFAALVVTVHGARLHRRGAAGDAGWLTLPVEPQEIDLTRYRDGATLELTRQRAPAGRYDAAEVLAAAAARGVVRGGERVEVPLELAPARVGVRVRAAQAAQVTFDLVVHDLRDHPGKTWGILLEEVRVEYPPATP